ncbi:MAG: SGNH/GDSL hydrolase family protein [Actinobacteria bacterium]|nr:SGNH/GDSL hydrolase family protein [Actinomycetota bacterium]
MRVTCLGDSITHGSVSSNYVDLLARRWNASGFAFVNAGVNGDLAYNVAQRLDAVIAERPDIVTLLVGTNDVNAQFDERWLRRYEKDQKLPVRPTRQWYAENVAAILARLASETDAKVVLLDIPPLGEDLSSRMNVLVREYNASIADVAAASGVPVLPLHDRLLDLLPPGHSPPAYRGNRSDIIKAALIHDALRRSWDDVSRRNGLSVLTDQIHLNDRAAGVVADLIGGVLGDA